MTDSTGATDATETLSLAEAIAQFIRHVESARRLSPHTALAYRRDLMKLARAMSDGANVADITPADIERALVKQRRIKPASIARLLSAWRGFFAHLVARRLLAANPVADVVAPKRAGALPKALAAEEMEAVLAAAATPADTDKNNALTIRDRAMMELLYSSGLRLSELTQLDVTDIDLADGAVAVARGKGGRGRVAPLGRFARGAIKEWLTARRGLPAADSPALFIGRDGGRLTGRSVQQRIDRHIKKIGFDKAISPHTFRHSCASHFLQASGDLRATQELLGHKAIGATQIYTRLDFQHLARVYDTAHPRAKK